MALIYVHGCIQSQALSLVQKTPKTIQHTPYYKHTTNSHLIYNSNLCRLFGTVWLNWLSARSLWLHHSTIDIDPQLQFNTSKYDCISNHIHTVVLWWFPNRHSRDWPYLRRLQCDSFGCGIYGVHGAHSETDFRN